MYYIKLYSITLYGRFRKRLKCSYDVGMHMYAGMNKFAYALLHAGLLCFCICFAFGVQRARQQARAGAPAPRAPPVITARARANALTGAASCCSQMQAATPTAIHIYDITMAEHAIDSMNVDATMPTMLAITIMRTTS